MGDVNVDDELALYDATREELRHRLSGCFPADFDLENTIAAYAWSKGEKNAPAFSDSNLANPLL